MSAYEKGVFITWATNKGSGEPAHKRSLAKAFFFRWHVADLEKASGETSMSVAQTGDYACVSDEPQNGKP